MKRLFRRGIAAVVGAVAMISMPTLASTPANTLVIAKDVSDIITFDPAEVFEISTGELIANLYDRIMMIEPDNLDELVGGVAESYEVSEDGRSITFRIREGLTFHSGNPVRPQDVEFSLERVVKLRKTPSFILTQFGWNADTVDDLVEVVDDRHVRITILEEFSPVLVLNTMSAGIASVVDRELVLAHEVDGDFGYGWLKSNSAGSGAYQLKSWKANESVVVEAFADYRHGEPAMKRVILQYVSKPATQRLLVEKGDVDIAVNLTPDQVKGIMDNPDVEIDGNPKTLIVYLAANVAHPVLGKPKVAEAIRYAIDYHGMANSFLAGQYMVHQSFWPSGLWASYTETPFSLDLDTARQLLEEAGHGDGFEIQLDALTSAPFPEIAQAIQATLAQIGITAEIVTHAGKTLWPLYRARRHDLILALWSPDYLDPHANADPFAHNPDNSDEAKLTGVLAWRNSWMNEDLNAMVRAAKNELDAGRREQAYFDLQKKVQHEGPYAIMFQQHEQLVRRANVQNFVSGPNFDLVFYRLVTK